MSNSEFDLDEALDIVAEARERKQKLRDALIEFAVSRGMVGDDYDGKHGEAGSRDQDAPYPEPLQEEFGAETPREHYEKDAQELGVELPDDASGEEKAGALMQAEMLGKTGDCQHESTREEVQHRDEEQAPSSNNNSGGSSFFDEPKESNGGDPEIDTDDVGKATKVEMAMSLVEDDGMDIDEAKAMVGL